MTGAFKVGEVLVGQRFYLSPEYNGVECMIVSGPTDTWSANAVTGIRTFETFYLAQWADGLVFNVRPRNLRRKQPPTGLATVLRMFDVTAPAPREVEAA